MLLIVRLFVCSFVRVPAFVDAFPEKLDFPTEVDYHMYIYLSIP